MPKTWTVQEAKAHLSEVLRRARAGEPQRIGVVDGCVVVSSEAWASHAAADLSSWLVDGAPRGAPLPVVARTSRRGDPFGEHRDGDETS